MADKQKKNTNSPLLVIILLAVIIVVAIFFMRNNKNESTVTSSSANAGTSVTEEEPEGVSNTLIDMTNTENAKISDGVKENISQELATEKTFKGMTVKDIKLVASDGISQFTATVENNSGSDYAGGKITIVFTNEDGSEYKRLDGILPAIKAGDVNEIDASTTEDVANAYSFSIE